MTTKLKREPILRSKFVGDCLQPGDVILSYKRPSNLLEAIAHKAIEHYQERLYPNGNNIYNHVRVVLGNFGNPNARWETPFTVAFEWTKPISRCALVEDWMTWEDYAHVYRHKHFPFKSDSLLKYAITQSGKLYDFIQLIGVGLGWKIGLRGREHCSSGARKLLEVAGSTGTLFSEVETWRTPPSSWANSPYWERIKTE